jgi:hypothetical protein
MKIFRYLVDFKDIYRHDMNSNDSAFMKEEINL